MTLTASAQDEDPRNEPDPVELERFSVTGYSVKRTEVEGPAPVDVYDRDAIEKAGVNTLGEFFRTLPQALGQVSELSQGSGFAGANYINLRGIGIDNTLTLINGKRISAYSRNGASAPFVDINSIPVAAIARVEILKDGASAIYGADAVAGVVNIILRERFDGLQIGGGYLTTSEGDGEEWSADLVWGWQNDATRMLATLSYTDKSPILARDRESTADVDYSEMGGPNFRTFNGTPANYLSFADSSVIPDSECGIDPNVSGLENFPFFGDVCLFNFAWFQQLTYASQRLGGNFTLRHDIQPELIGRFELFLSRRENTALLAPSPINGGFIPQHHPNNPYDDFLEVAGRPLDTGKRQFETLADTFRMLAGLEGTRGDWAWSADLLLTGNRIETDRRNAIYTERYYQALAGKGGPGGNRWYNPFGANPRNNPGVIDWMTVDTRFGADSSENALELEASTYFGNLPGGPVGFASGLQYRQQELDEFADEIERSGLLAGGGQVTQIQADRDILAAYAEFSLPLHASVEAQLAARYDHYSDFGSSTNPKLAVAWQPREDLLFRASYSTSFRPPTFTELFNPAVTSTGFFIDVERCEVTGAAEDCGLREYSVLHVGNQDLQPEEGNSVFAGVVWSPAFLEGLDLELDYWRFEHSNRIIDLDPQLILNASGDKGVTRAPPSDEDVTLGIPGPILELTETFENSDQLQTRGIDFAARYTHQARSTGQFRLSLVYTHVDEYTLKEATLGSAQAGINYAGKHFNLEFGIPKHRGNLDFNWQRAAHGIAARIHYTGDYQGAFEVSLDGESSPLVVDQHTTLDFQYRYTFNDQATLLRVGCTNCLDEAPPVTFLFLGEGLYDYRGAIIYARLQHHF